MNWSLDKGKVQGKKGGKEGKEIKIEDGRGYTRVEREGGDVRRMSAGPLRFLCGHSHFHPSFPGPFLFLPSSTHLHLGSKLWYSPGEHRLYLDKSLLAMSVEVSEMG